MKSSWKRIRAFLLVFSLLCLFSAGAIVTADSPNAETLPAQDTDTAAVADNVIRINVNDSSNGVANTTVPINVESTNTEEPQTPAGVNRQLFANISNFDGDTNGGLDGLSGRDLSTFRTDLIEGNLDRSAYDGVNPSGREYSALRNYLITG